MKFVAGFVHVIDLVNEWVGRVVAFLVLGLMGLVVVDTCLRYFFNSPLHWGMEMDRILMLFMVMPAAGYCFLHGGHVKVDVFYQKFPVRAKAVVDLITNLFLLALCVVLVKYGGNMVWKSFAIHEVSSECAWEYVRWPVIMAIIVM